VLVSPVAQGPAVVADSLVARTLVAQVSKTFSQTSSVVAVVAVSAVAEVLGLSAEPT
jgi:hypothetical protein